MVTDCKHRILLMVGEEKKAQKLSFRGASLSCTHVGTGYYAEYYVVKLNDGDWPSDADLISLLYGLSAYKDDDVLPGETPFGGAVDTLSDTAKSVLVYQD